MNSIQPNRQCATETPQETVQMEWAQINDHQVVVATKDRMWVRELDTVSGQDPFAEPMIGPGSKATTRQLLDAAWCAGIAAAQSNGMSTRRSLPRFVRELIGSYYLTSASPGFYREMASRFHESGQRDLEIFARRFARLENGDQQMAVDDMQTLGYCAEDLVRNCAPPPSAIVLREHFARQVRGPEPIDAFGYTYAIERSSLSITAEDLREFGSVLPPGVDAITCRRHHSGVGGDVAHVKYFIHACSRLPAADRSRIARATYENMTFVSSLPTDDDVEDAVLAAQYSRYRVSPVQINYRKRELAA